MEKFMKEYKGLNLYQWMGLFVMANVIGDIVIQVFHGPSQPANVKPAKSQSKVLNMKRGKKAS